MEVFLAAQRLAAQLKTEVDLVQLKESSTVFQKEVVAHGINIFHQSDYIKDSWELVVIRKYMKLNEEREALLNEYSASAKCVLGQFTKVRVNSDWTN